MLLMGLRLGEGIELARHAALAGRPLDAGAVAELAGDGLVAVQDGRLVTTAAGRIVLEAVLRRLLA